jgi:OCT family organic cation transporter-like MFS transporter 4/5
MVVNLLVMVFLWTASSFDYYMINFQLKYIRGDIFINTGASSFSEVFAYFLGGAILVPLGIKRSFIICFLIGAAGAFCLLFINSENVDNIVLAIFVMTTKFGVSATFAMVYIVTPVIFPPIYASTSMGICNFFSRLMSILSPEIAELPKPVPMLFFATTALLACGATFLLRSADA